MTTPHENGQKYLPSRHVQSAPEPSWMIPQNWNEAVARARALANSGIVPDAFRGKEADILVAMQMGAEIGLSPMQSLQNITVIHGKPKVYGDAPLALCQRHPDWLYMEDKFDEERETYYVWVYRRGYKKPVEGRFSKSQAIAAGLWGKGNWKSYPVDMLYRRALGRALNKAFADALCGLADVDGGPDEEFRPAEATVRDTTPTEAQENSDDFAERLKAKIAQRRGVDMEEVEFGEDDVVVEDGDE